MVDALGEEIKQRNNELKEEVESIYFGGGTPSLLKESQLKYLMQLLRKNYTIQDAAEITLEANPDDITAEALEHWQEAGINRLSIGIQSFKDQELQWMNRAHNAAHSLNCLRLVEESKIDSVSVDLIYGLPHSGIADWREFIRNLAPFNIQHLSAYALTVEQKTALENWVNSGKMILPDDQEVGDQFEALLSLLADAGFEQYEISNFARNKQYARHNTAYWQNKKYLGIGPSAHSFDGKRRRVNLANNQAYMQRIEQVLDYFEEEELTEKDRFNELLMTGLRTKWGVNIVQLKQIHPLPLHWENCLQTHLSNQNLLIENNQMYLTEKGKLLADRIASDLFLVD